MQKMKVAVIYGGKSTEHEVSVHSAKDVCDILAKKYEVLKIFIDKQGLWYLQKECSTKVGQEDKSISPIISKDAHLYTQGGQYIKIDVFFPVLHGAMGEDGTIQGLFEILNVPYVGCGVLTSAMGINKEISKLMASFYGVPIVPYIKLRKTDKYELPLLQEAVKKLGYPLFVKPVSLGSSIGVTRVEKADELENSIKEAFKYDDTLLIEKGIDKAREVFCAVMGDYQGEIHTSLCGELKTTNNIFFDYEAKYNIAGGCDMYIPAPLDKDMQDKIRKASYEVFRALQGNGLARVDFLISQDGKFYFSEINTLPGMSLTSLFPQLMEASGKKYEDVLDILINSALARKTKQDSLSINK